MDTQPEVNVTKEGGDVTIAAAGALDLFNSKEFHDALLEAANDAEHVIVDFRQTHYIDTAILADLAVSANKMRARGKRLKVVVAEPTHPHRTLEITGLTAVLDLAVAPKEEQVP
jgi:anti-anti-sigma factor